MQSSANHSDFNPPETTGKHRTLWQIIRYGIVGAMNTLLTLVVIFLFKSVFGCNEWLSNAIGYLAGFINSFLWNKLWVFKSSKNFVMECFKFSAGFLICYLIQFAVTKSLYEMTPLHDWLFETAWYTFSGYSIATLSGMIVYTAANFIYNRFVTFR